MKIFDMKGYIPTPEELTNHELGYNLADDTFSLKVDSGLVKLASPALGNGQKWVDMRESRKHDVVYKNNTGRPISVSVNIYTLTGSTEIYGGFIVIDGVEVQILATTNRDDWSNSGATFIVPTNATYEFRVIKSTPSGIIRIWSELR